MDFSYLKKSQVFKNVVAGLAVSFAAGCSVMPRGADEGFVDTAQEDAPTQNGIESIAPLTEYNYIPDAEKYGFSLVNRGASPAEQTYKQEYKKAFAKAAVMHYSQGEYRHEGLKGVFSFAIYSGKCKDETVRAFLGYVGSEGVSQDSALQNIVEKPGLDNEQYTFLGEKTVGIARSPGYPAFIIDIMTCQ